MDGGHSPSPCKPIDDATHRNQSRGAGTCFAIASRKMVDTGDLCGLCRYCTTLSAPIRAQNAIFSAFESAPWIPSAAEPACGATKSQLHQPPRTGRNKCEKWCNSGALFALFWRLYTCGKEETHALAGWLNFNPQAGHLGRIARAAFPCGGGVDTPAYIFYTWYRN
jgi:hypothetical protein